MSDKPPGKALGEHGEAGDEAFQNQRLDALEAFLIPQGYVPPVQTTGADAEVAEAEEPSA